MTERFVELPDRGVTLCVERAGTGPALVVLNGTGSDLRNHPNALRWPIRKYFDVLVYDHRCLGRSEQHDPTRQPTMADYAADAMALCDHEGIDEFAVIGISFGGMIAQELAALAGSRVTKLVLCCTSSGGEGGSSYPLHELYEQDKSLDDLVDLWDVRSATDAEVAAQIALFLGDGETLEDNQAEATPPGLLKQLEARRHHDMWNRLHLISAETMVAYGIHDGVALPENSKRLAAEIENAVLAPFDGGHMFKWQDRQAWPTIIEFLQAARIGD